MSFFSSLFSNTVDNKQRIEHLKALVENYKRCIENEKMNMARYRAAKAASHYQDGGKRNIIHYQKLIATCKDEIKRLKS